MHKIFASLSFALLLGPTFALAQTTSPETPIPAPQPTDTHGQLVSCFDYYRFGSIPVVLTTDTLRVAQGGNLNLKGTITNENAYPVGDLTVYAKIFYKKNFEKSSYGPDIVDWFVLADSIDLRAGETRQLTGTWKVPADLEPGSYQVATYVVSHDRFNMFGLTFTNDVVGSLFNFSVVGQDMGATRFDNTKTVLNGIPLHAAIFAPRTPVSAQGTPVTAVISNTSAQAFAGTVHWKLYFWDAVRQENLITESTQDVSVAAHASTTVAYTVNESNKSVYFLLGELVPNGANHAKSILQVRYVLNKDDATPRIGYVGSSAYPAANGTVAFACVHSTGTRPAKDVRLEVSAQPLDPVSWLLHLGSLGRKTYSGDAPGEMSALAFPLPSGVDNYAVTATLYQGGKQIDQVTATFGCAESQNGCRKSVVANAVVALAGLAIILLCAFALLRLRRKHRTSTNV